MGCKCGKLLEGDADGKVKIDAEAAAAARGKLLDSGED
jgi:hypothetical protein